jgi:hypothetical protein
MPICLMVADPDDLEPAFLRRNRTAMLVPQEARRCVLFLGTKDDKGKFRPRATAFHASMTQEGFTIRYLVTAEHVVSGLLSRGFDVWARFNLTDGTASEAKFDPRAWYFHPDNENNPTDVAVAPIVVHPNEDFMSVGLLGAAPMVATDEVIQAARIGTGDEVAIIGLFRSHHGNERNVPIVRIGNIAMLKGEPVYTNYCGYTEAHLVEARSISGLSGSPVFVHVPPVRVIDGHLDFSRTTQQFYLLGLVHGHFDVKNLTEDVVSDAENGNGGINTGVGIVIPVEKIIDTINHPDLVQMRRKAIDDIKRTSGVVADVDIEATPAAKSDANPTHREDFTSLLNAAVKTPARED